MMDENGMEGMIIKAVSLKIHNYQLRSLLKIYLASKGVSFVLTVKALSVHIYFILRINEVKDMTTDLRNKMENDKEEKRAQDQNLTIK